MADHHSQQKCNTNYDSNHSQNIFTPLLTPQVHSQQQSIIDMNANNIETRLSQAASLVSLDSTSSIGSTSSAVRKEDKVFDQIEDIISDYMRDSDRHFLQCRVLRWYMDEDRSRQFTAIVVINPPITKA
jgi:hypothetical protein